MATIILWRKDSNNDYVDVKHPQMQSPSFYYNLASSIMRSDTVVISWSHFDNFSISIEKWKWCDGTLVIS
jgi:hypothetical protein